MIQICSLIMSSNTASTPMLQLCWILQTHRKQKTVATCIGQTSFTFPHKNPHWPGSCNIMCYIVQNDFGSTVLGLAFVSSQYEHTFSFASQHIAGRQHFWKTRVKVKRCPVIECLLVATEMLNCKIKFHDTTLQPSTLSVQVINTLSTTFTLSLIHPSFTKV